MRRRVLLRGWLHHRNRHCDWHHHYTLHGGLVLCSRKHFGDRWNDRRALNVNALHRRLLLRRGGRQGPLRPRFVLRRGHEQQHTHGCLRCGLLLCDRIHVGDRNDPLSDVDCGAVYGWLLL